MATENPPPSPTPSQLPPVPASPTYSYASTANPLSQYNLPLPPPPRPAHAVLTKADLENSQAAYADLLASAKAYRVALASIATAASAFGSALESCARLKEARADAIGPPSAASLSNSFNTKGSCTADGLLAASGLQHLVANHHQILSETVYRAFEVPLLHELDKWRGAVDDEEAAYEKAMRAQSKEIRRLEKEGMKLHRQQRRRDVAGFREHLVRLTTRLDGLTARHADHSRTLLRESQDTSSRILDASCSLVRAEVDIFEGLARKGWTGGGLEDVLEKGVDLFASDDQTGDDTGTGGVAAGQSGGGNGGNGGEGTAGKLFSILPPKSILADQAAGAQSSDAQSRSGSPTIADSDRYQSLASAMDAGQRGRDAYGFDPNRPRAGGVRPFSPPPQPVRLNPDALIGWSSEDGGDEDESKGGTPIPAAKTLEPSDTDLASMSLTLDPVGGRREEEEDDNDERETGERREQGQLREEESWARPRDGDTPTASRESLGERDPRWSFAEDDGER